MKSTSGKKFAFDKYASEYDWWFQKNENVFESELLLLKKALGKPGKTLSVGCGTGLFEQALRQRYGIEIEYGVEPSDAMSRIAEKRGLQLMRMSAEELAAHPERDFDTVLFNGSSSYIEDLSGPYGAAHTLLKRGGRLVVLDVAAESGYGVLYELANELGSWEHPKLEGRIPQTPYPAEFLSCAKWKTVAAKTAVIKQTGFKGVTSWQTLTTHPCHSNTRPEKPIPGHEKGDYIALIAFKK